MSARDPIEAATQALLAWSREHDEFLVVDAGQTDDDLGAHLRAAIAAFLRARADTMTTGQITGLSATRAVFLREIATEVERGEGGVVACG